MLPLAHQILSTTPPNGSVDVYWAGQAGFIFKLHDGTLIGLDLYFSDCCNRYFGFKRLASAPISPWDLEFDYVITSHAHYDHFDVDSMPFLLSGNTKLIAARDCAAECERLGIQQNRAAFVSVGDRIEMSDRASMSAVSCDHGQLAPDAIGLLLNLDGKRIYYMGDTSLRRDFLDDPALQEPDLLILPINGAFGNLDSRDAAAAAAQLRPKLTIPCHFWTFAEHLGNPNMFVNEMRGNAPNISFSIMFTGERIRI